MRQRGKAMKRVAALVAIFLGAGAVAWLLRYRTEPEPGLEGQVHERTQDAESDPVSAGTIRQERLAVESGKAPAPDPALPEWAESEWAAGIVPAPGHLSAEEVATAQSYVQPLIASAAGELEALRIAAAQSVGVVPDVEQVVAEAKALRRLELWRAVEDGLRKHDFVVASRVSERLRPPEDVQFQTLPSWQDGESVVLCFAFEHDRFPALFDAAAYAENINRYRLEEAAREFNSLDYATRELQVDRYRKGMRSGSFMSLPRDLQEQFPLGVHVEEGSLLMHVAR